MEHSPTRAKIPLPQRSLEKLRAKRESIEKRRVEGSVESADDEDDEDGLATRISHSSSGGGSGGSSGGSQSRQHYRIKSVLPSSKLGIEMMRANSHDSVTLVGSESASTAEPTTQVVTPNKDLNIDWPKFVANPEPMSPEGEGGGDTTVIISTPPQPESSEEAVKTVIDFEETPRPTSSQERRAAEDGEPTPRPQAKSSHYMDPMMANFI
jgi:serine/threonine-protein kinase RIM15